MITLSFDNMEKLEEIAENINGTIYPNYSGRAMFGKQCVGITTEGSTDLLTLGIELVGAFGDDLAREFANCASWDSMGRGQIVYFKDIKAPEGWNKETEIGEDWCENNNCEKEECHRCFPLYDCTKHRKCEEAYK